MVKYLITVISVFYALNCVSQNHQWINGDNLTPIDTTFLKKEIKRVSSKDNKYAKGVDSTLSVFDVDSMCVIHILELHFNTLTNVFSFKEEKDKHRVFFTARNYLYRIDEKRGLSAFPIRYNQKSLFRMGIISHRDFEYVCFVPSLFPFDQNENEDNFLICKEKNSDKIYFIDAHLKMFLSMKEFIDYKVGSIENYWIVNKNRSQYYETKLQKNMETFSNVPYVDSVYYYRMKR